MLQLGKVLPKSGEWETGITVADLLERSPNVPSSNLLVEYSGPFTSIPISLLKKSAVLRWPERLLLLKARSICVHTISQRAQRQTILNCTLNSTRACWGKICCCLCVGKTCKLQHAQGSSENFTPQIERIFLKEMLLLPLGPYF